MASLAQLVGTGQIADMLAANTDLLHVVVILLVLVLLAARWLRKHCADERMFDRLQVQALKRCPKCSEQLPLSALICEVCEYNFLSGMVGHGHRLLTAPEPEEQSIPKRNIA